MHSSHDVCVRNGLIIVVVVREIIPSKRSALFLSTVYTISIVFSPTANLKKYSIYHLLTLFDEVDVNTMYLSLQLPAQRRTEGRALLMLRFRAQFLRLKKKERKTWECSTFDIYIFCISF